MKFSREKPKPNHKYLVESTIEILQSETEILRDTMEMVGLNLSQPTSTLSSLTGEKIQGSETRKNNESH